MFFMLSDILTFQFISWQRLSIPNKSNKRKSEIERIAKVNAERVNERERESAYMRFKRLNVSQLNLNFCQNALQL